VHADALDDSALHTPCVAHGADNAIKTDLFGADGAAPTSIKSVLHNVRSAMSAAATSTVISEKLREVRTSSQSTHL